MCKFLGIYWWINGGGLIIILIITININTNTTTTAGSSDNVVFEFAGGIKYGFGEYVGGWIIIITIITNNNK